jgi:O-antigen/teichoic acid export membrane protein
MSQPQNPGIPDESPVPETGKAAATAPGRDYINQGSRFMVLDNVSKVMEPLLVLLCARLYAGGEWGFFKYYESVLILLLRLACAGMDRGVVWIYSRRSNDEGFARVFSRAVNLVFVLGVVLALAAAAQWAGWLPSWTKFTQRSAGAPGFIIACYLLALPFQAASLLFYQAMINKRYLYPIILVRNMLVPALIYGPAIALAFTPLRPQGLAMPYLFGSVAGFALSVVFFFRAYPLKLRHWAWRMWVPADMIRFSAPLASTDVFMSFAYRADILLLGRYTGLLAVEVYAVVMMIANTLRSIRQSFDGILLSVFSKESRGRLTPHQRKNFSYAWWLVWTLQLPCLPMAMLFGGDLLGLVSPQYASGHPILVIVIAFLLLNTLGAFFGTLVTASGRTWFIFGAQLAYLVASLSLNTLLIPRYGMTGAAWAMGFSGMVSGGVCLAATLYYNRSAGLTLTFVVPALTAALWFLPAMLAYFIGDLGLALRAAIFAAGAAGFGLQSYVTWKKFNRS